MKYRTDFVTNSSSSSFVLNFSSEDNILTELAQSFDIVKDNFIRHQYAECFGIALADIFNSNKHTVKDILEAVENYEYDGYNSDSVFSVINSLWWECEWEAVQKAKEDDPYIGNKEAFYWARETDDGKACIRNMLKDRLSKLYDLNPDSILVGVEYEDHSERGCELEQDILPRLEETVLIVSNH